MNGWLIVGVVILVLIIGASGLYFVNINKLEESYSMGYNNCVEISNVRGNFAITKDNINGPSVSYLQGLYPEEVQSCIGKDGCFSSCGSPCSYINPEDLNFFEILKYKSKVCLTDCTAQCFYKI